MNFQPRKYFLDVTHTEYDETVLEGRKIPQLQFTSNLVRKTDQKALPRPPAIFCGFATCHLYFATQMIFTLAASQRKPHKYDEKAQPEIFCVEWIEMLHPGPPVT